MPARAHDKLLRDPTTKDQILDSLPGTVTQAVRLKLGKIIEQSMTALRAGNGASGSKALEQFRGHTKKYKGKWQTCGEHCDRHMDAGDYEAYAICYWGCIIRGGPTRSPRTPRVTDYS
jgi:hypothetical protein